MDSQVAVKAVIRRTDGSYLIVREKQRWQAVGGRLEKGERLEEGLRREVEEETAIKDIKIGKVIHVDEWFSKPEGELKHIVALFFLCDVKQDQEVELSDEHDKYVWIRPSQLADYDETIENEIKQAIILADM
jgi:8-oxo-dGTP pyrophosphatase MutT (NUDIX family)